MKTSENNQKREDLKPLSRDEMDILIYMTSDVWITPEIVNFKNDLIERAGN